MNAGLTRVLSRWMLVVSLLSLASLVAGLVRGGLSYFHCAPMAMSMLDPCCAHDESTLVHHDDSPGVSEEDCACCERRTFGSLAPSVQRGVTQIPALLPRLLGFSPAFAPPVLLARADVFIVAPAPRDVLPRGPPLTEGRARLMVFLN